MGLNGIFMRGYTMQYTSHYRSPMGDILLAADEVGLTGLWFEGQKYFALQLDKAHEEREIPLFAEVKRGEFFRKSAWHRRPAPLYRHGLPK